MRQVLRKIPGFRSGSKWKATVASFGYAFIGLIVLAIFIPTPPLVTTEKNIQTSTSEAQVLGESDAGSPIQLIKDEEVIYEGTVDENGEFAIDVDDLQEGENSYILRVCDPEDVELCWDEEIIITYAEPTPTPTDVPEGAEDPTSTESPDSTPTPMPTAQNNPNEQEIPGSTSANTHRVIRVIDGDTIEVEGGQTVRYIGINTPETVAPNRPVECFGKQASQRNKELVEGKSVRLIKDVSETDQYGRLLRYVYVGDTFINDYLVRQGYANASSYPPDVRYQSQLRDAEREARNNNRGLWESCRQGNNTSNQQPQNTQPPAPTSSQSSGGSACKYSCSSPDRDCSDFSSHSEAQAFFNCCGFSVNNDPMRLDSIGTGDGVACESI